MPPPCRNHRPPTACDTPTAWAASSGSSPLAISRQNARSTSRRCDGAPGDFISDRPVSAFIHPAGLPINTSTIKVLRRPVESALTTRVGVMHQPDKVRALAAAHPDGLFERVEDQLGAHARRGP